MSTIILTIAFPLLHQSVAIQFQDCLGFEVVSIGSTLENLELLVDQIRPNLAIIDLDWVFLKYTHLFAVHGIFTSPILQHMHSISPETKFVILATHPDVILITRANKLGIKGYLLKNDDLTLHLPEVIQRICNGGYAFSQDITTLQNKMTTYQIKSPLTFREIDILNAIISQPNLSHKEQAEHLEISKNTFDDHMRNIFIKLGASNLTAAILTAMRLGMIPLYGCTRQQLIRKLVNIHDPSKHRIGKLSMYQNYLLLHGKLAYAYRC